MKVARLGLIAALLLWGCDRIFPTEHRELDRISSPDERLEVVLVRTNSGATTGFVYTVHVVEQGDPIAPDEAVFAVDRVSVENIDYEWVGADRLQLSVTGGRVLHYRSYWRTTAGPESEYVIHIFLDHRMSEPDRSFDADEPATAGNDRPTS